MTRAKSRLFIGYRDEYLKPVTSGIGKYIIDSRVYADPAKISLTLTLEDVYLDRFAYIQHNIIGLIPGNPLQILNADLITTNGKDVLRFSRDFQSLISRYRERGFVFQNARVNHIVYRWDKKVMKEMLAVLPEVVLVRE
jgi:hypothetical protein